MTDTLTITGEYAYAKGMESGWVPWLIKQKTSAYEALYLVGGKYLLWLVGCLGFEPRLAIWVKIQALRWGRTWDRVEIYLYSTSTPSWPGHRNLHARLRMPQHSNRPNGIHTAPPVNSRPLHKLQGRQRSENSALTNNILHFIFLCLYYSENIIYYIFVYIKYILYYSWFQNFAVFWMFSFFWVIAGESLKRKIIYYIILYYIILYYIILYIF